jgi:hypothetical protein
MFISPSYLHMFPLRVTQYRHSLPRVNGPTDSQTHPFHEDYR